jgi:lysophospholipase L1-like esterase
MPHRDGRAMLGAILESHAPLDWVIIPSQVDGVHPDADGHRQLGEAIAGLVTCV